MTVLSDERSWRMDAACRGVDPRTFFPERAPMGRPRNDGEKPDLYGEARRVCRHCPVRKDCFDSVISLPQASDDSGMFAGLTPSERRQIRRCRSGDCEHDSHRGR